MEDIEGIEFRTKYKFAYDFIKNEYAIGNIHDPNYYTLNPEIDLCNLAILLLTENSWEALSSGWSAKYEVLLPDKKKLFNKIIVSVTTRLKQYKTLEMLNQVTEEIRIEENSSEKDEKKMQKLIQQQMMLTAQKKDFAKTTGTVIYRPL